MTHYKQSPYCHISNPKQVSSAVVWTCPVQ